MDPRTTNLPPFSNLLTMRYEESIPVFNSNKDLFTIPPPNDIDQLYYWGQHNLDIDPLSNARPDPSKGDLTPVPLLLSIIAVPCDMWPNAAKLRWDDDTQLHTAQLVWKDTDKHSGILSEKSGPLSNHTLGLPAFGFLNRVREEYDVMNIEIFLMSEKKPIKVKEVTIRRVLEAAGRHRHEILKQENPYHQLGDRPRYQTTWGGAYFVPDHKMKKWRLIYNAVRKP
ncbi:hypothetical protein CONPUDRAFT_73900 [Coniophora puteana RWD-64-598 SS2]|uniref:Uncharacterized protein n=1 Tax=Coniophora puteana (strain RWD-64-598) TaxID=741705 RepID=A0A5M3MKH0_CONPW|nr:uncharacterized protein CONPUDRAFT_73900 [Coniophora puteana RWD-64-598 SS2]EIW79460.1 hypothetical protein CONPUDRAFT_73900 [Coniophora puteana RWD-64-598 SS2]